MENMEKLNASAFWRGKRVLLTGHNGFKGTWATLWLTSMGAHVTGISLEPETRFFGLMGDWPGLENRICDLRDRETVAKCIKDAGHDIVLHMAAQALVRKSFSSPVETYATNLMGTLHLLEAIRQTQPPAVVLVVTSDKVYRNLEDHSPFRESDPLGGDDPYSASKGCAELAVQSWRSCGLCHQETRLATARAGNVIGGGDWSEDRLVPDLIRAWEHNRPLALRYPQATRPWQHVLDVLGGYFGYIQALASGGQIPYSLNFGPEADACLPTVSIVEKMQRAMGSRIPVTIESQSSSMPEKSRLTLDASLAHQVLGWRPRLGIDTGIEWTADWYRAWRQGKNMRDFSLRQISDYQMLKA